MTARTVRPATLPALLAILPAMLLAVAAPAKAAPGVSRLVREAVGLAFKKSGREVAERASREAVEQCVEAGVSKYGPRAAQAVADGGIELVEAGAQYGNDVMRAAVEATPAARRVLALQPETMLPLVRELGGEAIEIEAKSPGLARQVYAAFGDDGARRIERGVPAEDLPRLVSYAEKADSPATRVVLLEAYEKEGASLFQRIPPALVLSSGLTVGMLYGVHRATAPLQAIGDAIGNDPETRREATRGALLIFGAVAILATLSILASFRLTPWHAARTAAGDVGNPATPSPLAHAGGTHHNVPQRLDDYPA